MMNKITDEQIDAIWKSFDGDNNWIRTFGYQQFARAVIEVVTPVPESQPAALTNDAIFKYWLYRDCMDAIRAGDIKEQFVSAVRALLRDLSPVAPAAAPVAADAGWISVDERLPEPGGLYLVSSTWGVRPAWRHEPQWAGGCFQDAINSSDEGTTDFDGHCKGIFRVTHWRDFPAPVSTDNQQEGQ